MPSVILIIAKLNNIFETFIITYRIVCGTIYPPSILCGITDMNSLSIAFPLSVMAVYLLIPFFCALRFHCGYYDKLNPDKIIYK